MTIAGDLPKRAGRPGAAKSLRHFLDLDLLPADTLRAIMVLAHTYKRGDALPGDVMPARGKTLAMVFEKPSTRTRVSFEIGMKQMGGFVTTLSAETSQLGRGETISDTARVLSRYADVIMFRTLSEASLREMAAHASVPVINGLTDKSHPCQIMADIMTFEEIKGSITGRTVAWLGDGNNVCGSWIHGAMRFGYRMRIGSPKGFEPDAATLAKARTEGADITVTEDAAEAAAGADCIVTDTWHSMGVGNDGLAEDARVALFTPYRVDEALMARGAPDAVFMHCLPATRGREVSAGVIDGPRSVVWDEAENRLHVQKAILHWCLAGIGA